MNRKFLVMIGTICGLVMAAALVVFPVVLLEKSDGSEGIRAIELPSSTGAWLLIFTWLALAFAALVLVKRADYIGLPEVKCRMLSLLGFKLAGFFFVALLIAGPAGLALGMAKTSWGVGFWLAFIASIVGAFAIFLTFNEGLAQKIAAAAQDVGKSDPDAGGDAAANGDAAGGES